MTDKIKIYCFGSMDRSGRVRWLLEELGVAYEDHTLDYQKQEHKQEAFLKINSMGSVPAVVIDGQVLTESGAICMYLADKYMDKGFAPSLDSPHRASYLRWIVFVVATAEPIATEVFKAKSLPEQEQAAKIAEIKANFENSKKALEAQLGNNDYFVNNKFSTVDIMVASLLHWAKISGLIDENSSLSTYLERVKSRNAAQKSKLFVPFPM